MLETLKLIRGSMDSCMMYFGLKVLSIWVLGENSLEGGSIGLLIQGY